MSVVVWVVAPSALFVAFKLVSMQDRSTKALKVMVHETLLPFLTYVVILVIYLVLVPFGSPGFWLLSIPVVICCLIAQGRMRAEGRRYLRLRGLLPVPVAKEMVPRNRILVLKRFPRSLSEPDRAVEDRIPVFSVYQPGDLYSPEQYLPEAEYVWLSPGEELTITARLPSFKKTRKFTVRNKQGRLSMRIRKLRK